MKTNAKPRIGTRIVAALTEVRDVLASGDPVEKHMVVRVVEIPDPGVYTAKSVRKLRNQLGISQAVFARLLGVSTELVEHWEQGVTTPRPIARRLLDEVAIDPAAYLRRQLAGSGKRAAVA